MYAVVRTGGKEYRVSVGDVLAVEKLDAEAGSGVYLTEVLMAADGKTVVFGRPLIDGAKVHAEVVEQTKGAKVIVFKMKRRKGYRRKRGHRQMLSVLRITDIEVPGVERPKIEEARAVVSKPAEAEPTAEAEKPPAAPEKPAAAAEKKKPAAGKQASVKAKEKEPKKPKKEKTEASGKVRPKEKTTKTATKRANAKSGDVISKKKESNGKK